MLCIFYHLCTVYHKPVLCLGPPSLLLLSLNPSIIQQSLSENPEKCHNLLVYRHLRVCALYLCDKLNLAIIGCGLLSSLILPRLCACSIGISLVSSSACLGFVPRMCIAEFLSWHWILVALLEYCNKNKIVPSAFFSSFIVHSFSALGTHLRELC